MFCDVALFILARVWWHQPFLRLRLSLNLFFQIWRSQSLAEVVHPVCKPFAVLIFENCNELCQFPVASQRLFEVSLYFVDRRGVQWLWVIIRAGYHLQIKVLNAKMDTEFSVQLAKKVRKHVGKFLLTLLAHVEHEQQQVIKQIGFGYVSTVLLRIELEPDLI